MGFIRAILSTIATCVIFVFILLFVNIMALFLNNPTFHQVVATINGSIGLILTIALLTFVTDVFRMLKFPFNTPWPLFKGVTSVFVASFIISIVQMLGQMLGIGLNMNTLKAIVYPVVFVFVVVMGYFNLFSRRKKRRH